MKRVGLTFVIVLTAAFAAHAVDRTWQAGTWKDIQVKRAKVVFGVAPGNPNSGGRRSPPPTRETRLYVIETEDLRLELKQDATVDTPRLDVLVGQPVTFAIEKNSVYVKNAKGRETKLSVTKKTSRK